MKLWRVLLLMMLFGGFVSSAHALRCGSRLVLDGDQDFQVRDRCGQPYWIDRYTALDVQGAGGPIELQNEVGYEVWYYNFGPRQFITQILFRNGRMFKETPLSYGFSTLGENCDPNVFVRGLTSGELIARCGTPASQRNLYSTAVRRDGRGNERYRDVRREEWVYDFGENTFVRVLTLIDGRVDSVENMHR